MQKQPKYPLTDELIKKIWKYSMSFNLKKNNMDETGEHYAK